MAGSRNHPISLLACRHLQQGHDAASADSSHKVSNSAAAGLCSLFKAHARSCCLSLLQILGKPDTQLVSAVCTFLHQQLLAPSFDQISHSTPDLESCDPDNPSLAQEAFEQPQLIQDVTLSAKGLSGTQLLCSDYLQLFSSPKNACLNAKVQTRCPAVQQHSCIAQALHCRQIALHASLCCKAWHQDTSLCA